jgi:hypothetical protein
MAEKSMKTQAEEIMAAVDQELQEAAESKALTVQDAVDSTTSVLMTRLFGAIHDVDIAAATERVEALKEKYPDETPEQLSQRLIRDKIQRTSAVGAVTSGVGLIPGIGTLAALTVGVAADIGATFKLQAELVLEIATVYDYPLTESEKQRLVFFITGLSAGTSALARKAGGKIAVEVGERFAEKAIVKALPVIGVLASAGTNALSTYILGQRADAYFRLGPEAVPTWRESLRAISGVDERKVGYWLADSGRTTGAALVLGAGRMAETVGPAMNSGARMAGRTAQRGFSWYINAWKSVFRIVGGVFGFTWAAITFIPRKLLGLFKRKEKPTEN